MSRISRAKSPIIEVLAEFVFGPGENWNPTLPGRLHAEVADSHPIVEQHPVQNVNLAGPVMLNVAVQPGAGTVMFRSRDRLDVIQLGAGLLSVNRVAPYLGWPNFRSAALTAYAHFRRLVPDSPLVRVSLTFLNRFGEPAIVAAPLDYFVALARTGGLDGLPLGSFHVRSDYRVSEDYEAVGIQLYGEGEAIILGLTDALGGPAAVEVASSEAAISNWFDTAHNRLCGAFEGSLREPLLHSLMEESIRAVH